MKKENKPKHPAKWNTQAKESKQVRVLSTSLGLALLANAALAPGIGSSAAADTTAANGTGEPRLVEWSSEAVKKFYNPAVDWNIPLPQKEGEDERKPEESGSGAASNGGTGGTGGATVVNTYSGFGWDDLLLYQLLFNSGSAYSSSGWYRNRPAYYTNTRTAYKPKSYSNNTFQNKPVAGSSVRPRTSDTTGSITRRSTSSKPGGMGGKSSGLSSSRSTSSSSFGGGFGG
ncbi:MAG TPA: hypothetical protein VMS09_09215 [Paenibacillus sp.]|uniref:hypothetical protein n=1 Tax=Paenibacillus sp. TaxID=58172 RepID=UPI002C74325B|nr:hypothetical protein [Paenibacillus sp.]HUC92193.1 hypothetical protein [Paenibacillus sp.]